MTNVDKTARTPTEYPHIEKDYKGRPVIAGTRMRVSMLANMLNGLEPYTPETIVQNFDHLSQAQVYSAVAYYYDHKSEIDAEVEEENRFVEEFFNRPDIRESNERMRSKIVKYLKDHPEAFPGNQRAEELRRSAS